MNTISKDILLEVLPPYEDRWILINPNQSVHDIVKEVLSAHDEFSIYYDKICLYFTGDTLQDICSQLYQFCKNNFHYNEEKEDFQSTSVPQGLLYRSECDCKGYSNFIGGILDGLNRQGEKINWCYRFASYEILNKDPHHVFIVVNNNGNEIWIDPTPGASDLAPIWKIDKKIAAKKNTSQRVAHIGSISNHQIGTANLDLSPAINTNPYWATQGITNDNNLILNGAENKYPGVFTPYLGLSQYRDYGGDRNLNSDYMASAINDLISKGPMPGHTVDKDFIHWIYDTNLRSWNFYYPGGVKPGFSAAALLPVNYPKLMITQDNRLTFDRDVQIDDYRNPEIHLLTAWAQSLINQYDNSPYPVKPQALKEFSQLKEGNVNTRNLFNEARGTSIFQDIGKALESAVNFVKDGVLKIVGLIPRNAFLAMVGLNIFNIANDLQVHINSGDWNAISDKWKSLGGNPDKLRNTIEKGSKLPSIEDTSLEVDETAAIGVVQVAAIIAAAAPIIIAMLSFINKDGKLNPAIQATQGALQTAFPDVNFGFLDGALTMNGTPVHYQIDDKDNENSPNYNPSSGGLFGWVQSHLLLSAGIGLLLWEVLAPKKMRLLNK